MGPRDENERCPTRLKIGKFPLLWASPRSTRNGIESTVLLRRFSPLYEKQQESRHRLR
jgi:hypothetical protein